MSNMGNLNPDQEAQINQLTLEKLEINERLRKLEIDYTQSTTETKMFRDQLSKDVHEIKESVKSIVHKIDGNGEPGIDDRLKKIESDQERRKESDKRVIQLATSAFTALIIAAAAWFGKAVLALIKLMGG